MFGPGTLVAPILTWWAIGDVSTTKGLGAFHTFGPYHVNPHAEFVVGCLAAVLAVAALVVLVVPVARRGRDGRSWGAVACLCGAGALGAACWRLQTAGVDGANIGGGLLLIVGPVLIAGMLIAAVAISHAGTKHVSAKVMLVITAALTAPALYGVVNGLSSYDNSIGVISGRQYADVRVGETRAALHDALGGPGDDAEQFFAPIGSDASCEYYSESNPGTVPNSLLYRFCFRADTIVSKDRSNKIYGT
jgi:hypothetical protein